MAALFPKWAQESGQTAFLERSAAKQPDHFPEVFGPDYAAQRGVIIADTKFEFGTLPDGTVMVIDEVLTPDSSRFWPVDQYEAGHDQPSFDKQYVRNWLETQPWNKTPPAPTLPDDVVEGTRRRYIEAYERLTGRRWT